MEIVACPPYDPRASVRLPATIHENGRNPRLQQEWSAEGLHDFHRHLFREIEGYKNGMDAQRSILRQREEWLRDIRTALLSVAS